MRQIALVALALTACIGPVTYPRTVTEQYATGVKISVICTDGMQGGSGVAISATELYTAEHVITCEDGPPMEIFVQTDGMDSAVSAKPVAHVDGADIVRLQTVESLGDVRHVTIGSFPRLGDEICILGVTPRLGRKCGEVWERTEDPGNIKHTAITEPGNSGGPVYNQRGELVGIVTHLWYCSNGQICGGKAGSLEGREWLTF